jgi:antitoxin component of MazEF toxin-antitoxin module
MKLQITDPYGQARITVPKKFVEAKNWEDGEELKFKINNKGNLEIVD